MAFYLSESDVKQVLTMPLAIEEVERALLALKDNQAIDLPRQRMVLSTGNLNLLQAAAPNLGILGFKAYYGLKSNDDTRRRYLFLFDTESEAISAIIEADYLGMMRTGAATGLATRALSRPESRTVGLLGSGWQARGQLEGICTVRDIKAVKVFSRNFENLKRFCESATADLGITVKPVDSARAAVEGSDIVTTITRAPDPVLEGRWLEAGQHINAVGSNALNRRELDTPAILRCDVIVVDSRPIAKSESGNIYPVVDEGQRDWESLAELKDLVRGHVSRKSREDVTLFESHGMALQDIFVGAKLVALARERGLGVTLPLHS